MNTRTLLLAGVFTLAACAQHPPPPSPSPPPSTRPATRPAATPAALRAEAVTTLYLVRHAEKAPDPGDGNPALSEAGQRRAEGLTRVLASVRLDAIYTTPWVRTRQTVAPVAAAQGIRVEELQVSDPQAIAELLIERHPGQRVLVTGHSNTLPDILAALGVPSPPTLADHHYDALFLVVLGPGGLLTFEHLHYGPENPEP